MGIAWVVVLGKSKPGGFPGRCEADAGVNWQTFLVGPGQGSGRGRQHIAGRSHSIPGWDPAPPPAEAVRFLGD